MRFAEGHRLAGFEVVAPLGSGGMGEVYRARDLRLGREVALKVLPEGLASTPERLERFDREARLLASLAHPNIAAIHGVEEEGGVRLLVLELVEGPTLAERLAAGPLALPEALDVCRQVAAALEQAHARGIVHRDLKPANIKVTPEGRVKVLDFGLAKALAPQGDIADSPTGELATREGLVMGTAAYMSPEQARGHPVGRQGDVWSFGCVLYESLTGVQAFAGGTVSDRLVAVLTGEPDWTLLPPSTPGVVEALVRRCLQKELSERLADIAVARMALDDAVHGGRSWPPEVLREPRRAGRRRLSWTAGLAGLVVGGLAVFLLRPSPRAGPPRAFRPLRLGVVLPPGIHASDAAGQPVLALSPDGERIVFAGEEGGRARLYVRDLARLDVTAMPGTEGGSHPFFSPDGAWVGFWAEGSIRRVRLGGGEALAVAPAPRLRGAAWLPGDTIVFAASATEPLKRVRADGGAAEPITTLGPGESSHRWPHGVANGRVLLFNVATASGREEERAIDAVDLETGRRVRLLEGGSTPRYAAPGWLLFTRGGSLLAAPFDADRLELRGPPAPVLEDVRGVARGSGLSLFDVAPDGTLAYVPGFPRPAERALAWVDRSGHEQPLADSRPYLRPVLSPDGRRMAVTIQGPHDDVWVHDLGRGTWTRVTLESDNANAVWTPDGARLVFSSNRRGAYNVFQAPVGGGAVDELTRDSTWNLVSSISPDGRRVAVSRLDPHNGWDIVVLAIGSGAEPRPLLATRFSETYAAWSPDGRFLAYVSDESGRAEVYVRAADAEGKWPVSATGGGEPVWSRDGSELFFRAGDALMAAPVRLTPTFSAGAPRRLWSGPYEPGLIGFPNYDVSPDGRRFLMVRAPERREPPLQLVIAPGWTRELAAAPRP